MKESVKPYLLYVGNLYPHKNIAGLIAAFKKINSETGAGFRLMIAGGNPINSEGEIIFTGFTDEENLDELYRKAQLLIFPSFEEGFGFPPLEAMKRGVAVVCSNTSCLPEILGDAAIYFNPYDINDIAGKIKKVLFDEDLKKELVKRGLERVKKYSWSKTAEETLSVYENIL